MYICKGEIMAKKKNNKNKNSETLKQKLVNKYRLVIINEDTFEEKVTFRLTRLNVFVFGTLFSIILIVLTIFLIAFTSLREYIPGYSPSSLSKKANDLFYKVDSLERLNRSNTIYIKNIKDLLAGNISGDQFKKDSISGETVKYDIDTFNLKPSEFDIEFRQNIESQDRFSLFNQATKDVSVVFFAPVNGTLIDGFNIQKKHFAVDLIVESGTPVKSVADGTVIFAEWTAQTGHVIIVKHAEGFTSVYKHNTSLHKEQGDLVKSGEVISVAGDTGEYSTGPHLHFELWNENFPVDPTKYIDFE